MPVRFALCVLSGAEADGRWASVRGELGGALAKMDADVRLVVSGTSWTPDEDFGILLQALAEYDARGRGPRLLVCITGKGPLRRSFEAEVARAGLKRVRIVTAWFSAADYARLLSAADCGVSLHTSSSGLDLPMKVVDMFGAGLPVCAVDFASLDELVQDGVNGRVFRTAPQLCRQLEELLSTSSKLAQFRHALRGFGSWDEEWTRCARPVFE